MYLFRDALLLIIINFDKLFMISVQKLMKVSNISITMIKLFGRRIVNTTASLNHLLI